MKATRNPKAGTFKLPEGYKDIGWFVSREKSPEFNSCLGAGHRGEEFDNSLFLYRCTDVIRICHECKIVSHVDMSD